jgi:hypothetical protein
MMKKTSLKVKEWRLKHPEHKFQRHEYYLRNKKSILNASKRYHHILRKKSLEFIGDKCLLCGKKESLNNHLILHEKSGKKHIMEPLSAKYEYICSHKDDFIPLCVKCHDILHKIKLKGMNITKLLKLVKKLKS